MNSRLNPFHKTLNWTIPPTLNSHHWSLTQADIWGAVRLVQYFLNILNFLAYEYEMKDLFRTEWIKCYDTLNNKFRISLVTRLIMPNWIVFPHSPPFFLSCSFSHTHTKSVHLSIYIFFNSQWLSLFLSVSTWNTYSKMSLIQNTTLRIIHI